MGQGTTSASLGPVDVGVRTWPGAAAVVLVGMACYLAGRRLFVPDLDNAYLLQVADQILSGGRYFFDIFEINPPLYSLLLIPVHGLHRLTGVALYSCFIAWISFLVIASSLAVWRHLADVLEEGAVGRALIAVAVELTLFFLPGLEFGQRDHLAVVLFLPALPWLAARQCGRPTGVGGWLTAAAASVGFLIKPHLLLIPALFGVLRLLEQRTLRVLVEPFLLCQVAGGCIYLGLVVWLFPEWFAVARVGSVAYAAYDATSWISRRTVLTVIVIAVLAATNELFSRSSPPEKRLGRILAVATSGALGSYVMQHKDIDYQFIPTKMLLYQQAGMAVLAGARWLADVAPRSAGAAANLLLRQRSVVVCLLLLLSLPRTVAATAEAGHRADQYLRSLAALLQANAIGPRLVEFGTSAFPAYPLSLYRATQPAWRLPQLWILPWIVQREKAGHEGEPQTRTMAALLRAMVREDFRRFAPDAILVDESPDKLALPAGFDIMAWFREDPAMAAILDRYERVAEFDDSFGHRLFFTRLGLYRRRSP
jgi:hypothetical protein